MSCRTVILHQRLHVLLDAFVPLGDVDMQRVVAAGLAVGPLAPLLEGGDEADARLGYHVVNWIKHTHTRTQSLVAAQLHGIKLVSRGHLSTLIVRDKNQVRHESCLDTRAPGQEAQTVPAPDECAAVSTKLEEFCYVGRERRV